MAPVRMKQAIVNDVREKLRWRKFRRLTVTLSNTVRRTILWRGTDFLSPEPSTKGKTSKYFGLAYIKNRYPASFNCSLLILGSFTDYSHLRVKLPRAGTPFAVQVRHGGFVLWRICSLR